MPAGAFTGARSFEFSNTILATGAGVQTYKDIIGDQAFRPQCLHVNSSVDTDQDDAGWCVIDGYLFGENETFRKLWRIPVRQPVGYAFAAIYSEGTTGRGIRIISEG